MITYKYLRSPKVGDLVGFAKAKNIHPGVIVEFGKTGALKVLDLGHREYCKSYMEKTNELGITNITKAYAQAIVPMDFSTLSVEEKNTYNFVVKDML